MGLFSKKETCSLCGAQDAKQKLIDGYICKACQIKCEPSLSFSWKDSSVEHIKKCMASRVENGRRKNIFSPDKKVEKFIWIDSANRMWQIPAVQTIFTFDELLGYEVLQDGETIISGGLGSAVVGGALFGETGAVIGGITGAKKTKEVLKSLCVKCILDNPVYPHLFINILHDSNVKAGGLIYNVCQDQLQKVLTELQLMENVVKRNAQPTQKSSGADEIVKYKNLLDQGIITQQEFDAKKKQLLGL